MNVRAFLQRNDVRALLAAIGWGAMLVFFSTPPARVIAGELPPAPAGSPVQWLAIAGRSAMLRRGRRYRVCLSLPWYLPGSFVTADKIRERAASEGFTDVVATKTTTGGECDWFVEATYAGADRAMDLPSALPYAWEAAA